MAQTQKSILDGLNYENTEHREIILTTLNSLSLQELETAIKEIMKLLITIEVNVDEHGAIVKKITQKPLINSEERSTIQSYVKTIFVPKKFFPNELFPNDLNEAQQHRVINLLIILSALYKKSHQEIITLNANVLLQIIPHLNLDPRILNEPTEKTRNLSQAKINIDTLLYRSELIKRMASQGKQEEEPKEQKKHLSFPELVEQIKNQLQKTKDKQALEINEKREQYTKNGNKLNTTLEKKPQYKKLDPLRISESDDPRDREILFQPRDLEQLLDKLSDQKQEEKKKYTELAEQRFKATAHMVFNSAYYSLVIDFLVAQGFNKPEIHLESLTAFALEHFIMNIKSSRDPILILHDFLITYFKKSTVINKLSSFNSNAFTKLITSISHVDLIKDHPLINLSYFKNADSSIDYLYDSIRKNVYDSIQSRLESNTLEEQVSIILTDPISMANFLLEKDFNNTIHQEEINKRLASLNSGELKKLVISMLSSSVPIDTYSLIKKFLSELNLNEEDQKSISQRHIDALINLMVENVLTKSDITQCISSLNDFLKNIQVDQNKINLVSLTSKLETIEKFRQSISTIIDFSDREEIERYVVQNKSYNQQQDRIVNLITIQAAIYKRTIQRVGEYTIEEEYTKISPLTLKNEIYPALDPKTFQEPSQKIKLEEQKKPESEQEHKEGVKSKIKKIFSGGVYKKGIIITVIAVVVIALTRFVNGNSEVMSGFNPTNLLELPQILKEPGVLSNINDNFKRIENETYSHSEENIASAKNAMGAFVIITAVLGTAKNLIKKFLKSEKTEDFHSEVEDIDKENPLKTKEIISPINDEQNSNPKKFEDSNQANTNATQAQQSSTAVETNKTTTPNSHSDFEDKTIHTPGIPNPILENPNKNLEKKEHNTPNPQTLLDSINKEIKVIHKQTTNTLESAICSNTEKNNVRDFVDTTMIQVEKKLTNQTSDIIRGKEADPKKITSIIQNNLQTLQKKSPNPPHPIVQLILDILASIAELIKRKITGAINYTRSISLFKNKTVKQQKTLANLNEADKGLAGLKKTMSEKETPEVSLSGKIK